MTDLESTHSINKEVLILQRTQYGYLTDTKKISERLAKDMVVSVVCFDAGQAKVKTDSVTVHYVDRRGNFFIRAIRLVKHCIAFARTQNESTIFVLYFPLCALIPLCGARKAILDFRTASVHQNKTIRFFADLLASAEVLFFQHVTVISEGLLGRLHIAPKKAMLLPLGADQISTVPKNFDEPRLFYIGILENRNIEQTIEGIKIFLDRWPERKEHLSYDIVGDGYKGGLENLQTIVNKLGLEKNVKLWGRLNHDQAQNFFDSCNIGISYVPMTVYYDHQPPTKTFEYVLSGMPVIATSTLENKKIVVPENGVLCEDNPESFAFALEQCINKFDIFHDTTIRNTLKSHTWDNIAMGFKSYLMAVNNA